jgi:gliding motility-associated lipoprotein GldH
MTRSSILSLLCCIWVLNSCSDPDLVLEEFVEVDGASWYADSTLTIRFEQLEPEGIYEMGMHLRHNQDYPYSNLFVLREVYHNDVRQFGDTLQIAVADSYGRWLGEGVGDVRQMDFPYRKSRVKLQGEGVYTFTFTHAMRKEPLPGVVSVGLSIRMAEALGNE